MKIDDHRRREDLGGMTLFVFAMLAALAALGVCAGAVYWLATSQWGRQLLEARG